MHATTHDTTRLRTNARRRMLPRRGPRVLRAGHEAPRRDTVEDLRQSRQPVQSAVQTVAGPPARLTGGACEPLRFGRFAGLGRIGEGAMSRVYAAHDPTLGRKVAIKLVHDDGDAESRARAELEAQALARISHPNVVQIFEVGAVDGQVFVAMEFIDGTTLTGWQTARPRSVVEVLRMYVQAGRGLVAAHAAGIVHRDFKSDNVLVGRDGRARVVDFGLALVRGGPRLGGGSATDPGASPRLTSSGTVMGTPAYMSPEQHRGSEEVDERSDQFNFCAALYEALYRVRPFAGNTLREVASQVRSGVLQKPAHGTVVPDAVRRAVLRGLAARPGQRWTSLAELLDHLEQFEATQVEAPPASRSLFVFLLAVLGAGLWAVVLGSLVGLARGGTATIAALNVGLVVAAFVWLSAGGRVRAVRRRSFGRP